MKLEKIAEALGARVLPEGATSEVDIERVYAGDRVSDLLDQASASTLLVTNLASRQLLRLADLMDIPAILFLNGTDPDDTLLQIAREHGTALLVSPFGMFETCGRLYERLRTGDGSG